MSGRDIDKSRGKIKKKKVIRRNLLGEFTKIFFVFLSIEFVLLGGPDRFLRISISIFSSCRRNSILRPFWTHFECRYFQVTAGMTGVGERERRVGGKIEERADAGALLDNLAVIVFHLLRCI